MTAPVVRAAVGVLIIVVATVAATRWWTREASVEGNGSSPRADTRSVSGTPDATTSPVVPVADAAVAPSTADAHDAAPAPTIADAPLPPADAPLADIHDDLAARAMRGERAAACRLAQDLMLCRMFGRMPAGEAMRIQEAAAQASPGSRDEAAAIDALRRLEMLEKRGPLVCGRDNASQGQRNGAAWRYLLRAAELGDGDAALEFALAPPLSRERFVPDLDAWTLYRDRAPVLLRRAADRGHVGALFAIHRSGLGGAGAPGGIELGALTPTDAAVAALILRDRVDLQTAAEIDATIAAMRRQFDDATWRAITARADDARRTRFADDARVDVRGMYTQPLFGRDCAQPR